MNFCTISLSVSEINTWKYLTLNIYVKVTEYNYRNNAFQMSTSVNILLFLSLFFAKRRPVRTILTQKQTEIDRPLL